MKHFGKYLAAVCVIALSGVLLAGCSGQASSSAASASSASASASASSASASASSAAADTEALIKELEAIPGYEDAKSITIDVKTDIALDLSGLAAALEESASASSAAASASASSAAASESVEMTLNTAIKADQTQDPAKLYLAMDLMGVPCEIYITGDNVVIVADGEAYGGTVADLVALGMGGMTSVDSAMNQSGAPDFDAYKAAVESISKEAKGSDTVYTVVVDPTKLVDAETLGALSALGMSGEASKIVITYTIGADGKLAGSTMDLSAAGFTMKQDVKVTDIDKTVIPDAPAATKTISDLQVSSGEAAASGQAA